MQLTLMDFQIAAVGKALAALKRCRRDWREDGERSAFVLSAPTGAGKTVIASAIIEALLHGSDEFETEPDPTAVLLWVTKDPSLNEQTRRRIIDTADRVPPATLHVVDNNFTDDRLNPGNVYFINTGKLAVTSLLVRKSNNRQTTFWEVLDNTVRDPLRTLYVIIDEAHEGMKPLTKSANDSRLTLVRKVIDGDNGFAAVPIVMGLSATPKRFTDVMEHAEQRTTRAAVAITPAEVQASGLLKSSLHLLFPDEAGDFATTLIREATRELVSVTDRWAAYCQAESIDPAVKPLMVVQIPNREGGSTTAEDKEIRRILDTVKEHLPGFNSSQVGHVLSDRELIELGDLAVAKVAPEDVQGDSALRLLIAKDAVSTGWDCPRAEVLVSLRPAKERQYITQLLGRMVRTPLAATTTDDQLNSASAYLPLFDRAAAKAVADDIMGIGSDGATAGPKVMLSPVDLTWNSALPQDLKGLIATLPSLPKPSAAPKPVKRMLAMAAELAGDGLAESPDESSVGRLCAVIDGFLVQHAVQVDQVAQRILTADLTRRTVSLAGGSISDSSLAIAADTATIDDAMRLVSRQLSSKVVNAWLRARFAAAVSQDMYFDADAIKVQVAAAPHVDTGIGLSLLQRVEQAADEQVGEWFNAIRTVLPTLPAIRRARYEMLRAQAATPQETSIQLPVTLRVEGVDADGEPLPRLRLHVLANANGEMPWPKGTSWENEVVQRELSRPNIAGWYRNPGAGAAALQIAYRFGQGWKSVQPDFLIFENNADGSIGCSIVDPHGHHLSDALAKLHALAAYAERYAGRFNRVDAVAKLAEGEPLRVLELHRAEVRAAVLAATDAKQLFAGEFAQLY